MITTLFILSAMFLSLFVLNIPIVILVEAYGDKRQIFVAKFITAFMISATIICLIAVWALYIG